MIRESIAYERDFKNGIEKEYIKHKPKNAMVKGFTTIELFDAETGEKTYEVLSENIINDSIYKKAYMDYLYCGIRNRGPKGGSVTRRVYPLISNNIIFTDYTGVENSAIDSVKGNIIGYADFNAPYIGTDTLKGSINKSECNFDYFGLGTIKYVFDFPTNACNGTFRTVWWGDVPGVNADNLNLWNAFTGGYYDRFNISNNQNALAFLYTIGKIASIAGTTITLINPSDGTGTTVTSPKTYSATAYRISDKSGTNIIVYNYTTWEILEYTVDMNLVKTYTITKPALAGELLYCYLDDTYIYALSYQSGKYTVYKIRQTDNVLVGTYPLCTGTANSSFSLRVTSDYIEFMFGSGTYYGTYYKYDFNGNMLNTFTTMSNGGYKYYGAFIGKFILENRNGDLYTTNRNLAPLAQNLLPAPVTKNATQTMKVTYTFNVEVIDGL